MPNVSKEQMEALRDLRNRDDIVIAPVDKGNATVVLDKTEYEESVRRYL